MFRNIPIDVDEIERQSLVADFSKSTKNNPPMSLANATNGARRADLFALQKRQIGPSTVTALIAALTLSACASAEPAVAISGAGAKSSVHDGPYSRRDGRVEALADLRAGKPARLYSHLNDGEGPGYATPGLYFCDPGRNNGMEAAKALFMLLPEADFAEGRIYSDLVMDRAKYATLFARTYNLTVFQARKAEVIRSCPNVSLH